MVRKFFVALAVAAVLLGSASQVAHAQQFQSQQISFRDLIELLISVGVIPADKAAVARSVVSPATTTADGVVRMATTTVTGTFLPMAVTSPIAGATFAPGGRIDVAFTNPTAGRQYTVAIKGRSYEQSLGSVVAGASDQVRATYNLSSVIPAGSYNIVVYGFATEIYSQAFNVASAITNTATTTRSLAASCSATVQNDVKRMTWTSSVSGGTAPYTYAWNVYNDATTSGGNLTASSFTASYGSTGIKQATLRVSDAVGNTASVPCSATITTTAAATTTATTVGSPAFSSTSWYSDDSSTWPTISVSGSLTSSQAIRVKDSNGTQYLEIARGLTSGKLTRTPANGTNSLIAYVYDFNTNSYVVTDRVIGVSVSSKPATTQRLSASCSAQSSMGATRVTWSASVSGGTAPYYYSWSMYDDNRTSGGLTSSSITATYESSGFKTASVSVRDSAGNTTNASCNGTAAAAIIDPALSKTSWHSDDSSTWPTVSTPSYLNQNQAIRVKSANGTQYFEGGRGVSSGRITSSPPAGTTQLIVYIYDYSANAYATSEKTVSVSVTQKPAAAPELSVSCVGATYSGEQKIGWSASVSGGTAPYAYAWNVYNDATTSGGNLTASSFTASYGSAGSKQAMVRVSDSAGKTASYTCNATAASPAVSTTPTSAYLSLSSYCVVPGQNVTVTAVVQGGATSKVLEKDTNSDGVFGQAASWGSGAGTHTFTTAESPTYSGKIGFRLVVNGQTWDTKYATVDSSCGPTEDVHNDNGGGDEVVEDDQAANAYIGVDAAIRLIQALIR